MSARMLRTSRTMTVCRCDADHTIRFFRVPRGAAVAIVAESLVSGCVEIRYERNLYVTFKRNLLTHSHCLTTRKGTVISKFYVVQKNGIPAVWQVTPDKMPGLLKRKNKVGYSIACDVPSNTRTEALNKLRELFPHCRPARTAN